MRKRQAAALFLVLMMSVCLLSACTGTTTQEPVAYGMVTLNIDQINYVWTETDAWTKYQNSFQDDFAGQISRRLTFFPIHSEESVKICDVSACKDNVHYVIEDYSSQENAVVVSKWMYYYSVLRKKAKENNQLNISVPIDNAFIDNLFADGYYMEKMKFALPSTYVIEKEGSDYYGFTVEEAFRASGIGWSEYSYYWIFYGKPNTTIFTTSNPMCIVDPEDVGEETWGLYMRCLPTLGMAAFARYGAIAESDFSGAGSLSLDLNNANTNQTQVSGSQNIEINVVGYIETEADKLLSTGVSMDKNSDEYKIVMQQLQNPVFYSVCGNILE